MMARIVVVGGGVVALGAAMLLAADGHRVTVLERDPQGPPSDPIEAWDRWQRPGLNQFRMAHAFLGGRRSALPGWLEEIGARRPGEELEDSGFVYYGRHFRSADGSVPPMLGPGLMHWGTVSSLTLPADNGTWAVALVAGSKDTALRPLREMDRWEAVTRALPLVAHWLDGTPIDDGVQVMSRLEDRHRDFVADGQPVATGVVAVADSWACSNPANGRGASIGLLHARTLRDQLRGVGLDDPAEFADAFWAATAESVEPWYRTTLTADRHRLGEIEAGIRDAGYDSPDPAYQFEQALRVTFGRDPECTRAEFDIRFVLRTPEEVFAQPGLREKTLQLGSGWRDAPPFGPTREDLLAVVS
jgi:hypothetical protein